MTRKTWVQDPHTGKLIPKDQYVRRSDNASATIQGDIEPFVSPIDGKTISSRSVLRQHHREHGVTDARDYSHEYMLDRSGRRAKAALGQTAEAKQERITLIRQELEKHDR